MIYDQTFYKSMIGGAEASARVVVPHLLRLLQPGSVVDVGCGRGVWLNVFKEHGVGSIHGYDGPWVRPEDLRIGREEFTAADVSALGEVRRADLAVCLEVAEHVPEERAGGLVDGLVRVADAVCFSAAIPGQGGTGHVHEAWPSYWCGQFARHDYELVDVLRPLVWTDERVEFWYRQNLLLFLKQGHPALERIRGGKAEAPAVVDMVHPACYRKAFDPENYTIRKFVFGFLPGYFRYLAARMNPFGKRGTHD